MSDYGMRFSHTISQDKDSGLYYVHMVGYPYIPAFGTFSKTKREAEKHLVNYIGMTWKDYCEWKKQRRGSKTLG